MNDMFTVMGAGVAGLCMATELLKRGANVKVIDPNGPPSEHACSWWAGGMLAPECEGLSAEPSIINHGRRAANWWENHGVKVHQSGTLVLALGRDQSELKTFSRRVPLAETVNHDEIAVLEPHLADHFSRALFIKNEAHLDPRIALSNLYDNLVQNDVQFETSFKPVGQLIDCSGLSAMKDLSNLRGVKGEMVVIRTMDVSLNRPVRLLHPRFPLYIVPRGDGVFMLGATQIESGERTRATVRSVVELLNAAYALHPAFGEAELLEIGVDARPAFPDNQPRIYKSGRKIYANGLFRHGFLLAPELARMTTDLLLCGKIPENWYENLD